MDGQKKYENVKKLLIALGTLIFFIGMHNTDNAVNFINLEREFCFNGEKIRTIDHGLLFSVPPKLAYMLGMFMILIGFGIIFSVSLFL